MKFRDAIDDLLARHPRLFGDWKPDNSCLPGGWLELADLLATDMEATLDMTGALEAFRPLQIKEKLAELRFYFSLGADDDGEEEAPPLHADLFGVGTDAGAPTENDVRVEPTVAGVHFTILPRDRLTRSLFDLVNEATKASRSICMTCGAPGRVRVRGGGYYLVACDKHARGAVLPETWRKRREQAAAAAAKKKAKKEGGR